MAKSSLNKFKRFLFWVRSHKLYSLFIFIVLLVIGVLTYQRVALELNKRAFAQAREAIDTVYTDILTKNGEPIAHVDNAKCSRVQEVLGQGQLSCYRNVRFIYEIANKTESDKQVNNIRSVINSHKNLKTNVGDSTSPFSESGSDSSPKKDTYRINSSVVCDVNYAYNPSFDVLLGLSTNQNKNVLYISIYCSGTAREAYYMLQS